MIKEFKIILYYHTPRETLALLRSLNLSTFSVDRDLVCNPTVIRFTDQKAAEILLSIVIMLPKLKIQQTTPHHKYVTIQGSYTQFIQEYKRKTTSIYGYQQYSHFDWVRKDESNI